MTIEKRILSIFLALVIAVSLFPAFGVEAWAAEEYNFLAPKYNITGVVTSGAVLVPSSHAIGAENIIESGTTLTTWGTTDTETWYLVTGSGISINQTVIVKGDVHLILADGCNIEVTAIASASNAGINVASGSSLTIYGQTEGTGQLTATGNVEKNDGYYGGAGIGGNMDQPSGKITINGGTVIASSGSNAAGIGGGKGSTGSGITINGGNVTATGNNGGSGIGGGNNGGVGSNITINGGTVTATGGIYFAAGIGGGYQGVGRNITINGGNVTANGGANGGAGIGNGRNCTTSASSIKINKNLILKAGASANPTDEVSFVENEDVASQLDNKQYATVSPKPNYLTFINAQEEESSVTFGWNEGSNVQYSTKGSLGWSEFTDYPKGTEVILSAKDDAVRFKGIGVKTLSSNGNHFAMTGTIAALGSVTSLTDGHGGNPDVSLAEYCYYYMFYGCTSLTTAPELPATTVSNSCYAYMFQDCTSLTTSPELPATTLAVCCYSNMFNGCTSLKMAPNLPAKALSSKCYQYMFCGCTSLTVAPELPAKALAESCYYYMFKGCTSLTTAPELPAEVLKEYCYGYMFSGCSSLKITTNAAISGVKKVFTCPSTSGLFYAVSDMFSGTAGPVTGTPIVGETYYYIPLVAENIALSKKYTSVQAAIDEATNGDTIKLVEDAIENISIPENKSIILDLNDKVLEGDGTSSVITNNGTLTIKDSNPSSVHYFEYATQAAWTLTGASVNAIGVDQITSTTALGTIIKVSGGCITGGTGNTFFGEKVGGGIFNDGSLSIKGCNIIGNTAVRGGATYITMNNKSLVIDGTMIAGNTSSNVGAGVYIHNDSSFRMIDGTIRNNSVTGGYGGGGVYIRGSFTMEDGEISNNYAKSGTGVYVYYNDHGAPNTPGAFTMSAGAIKNNIATDKGGGVYVDDHADVLICGTITGNTAGSLGGGVCCNSPITVGKTSNITDNKVSNNDSNVALRHDGKAGSIEISTEQPLENGACIGVSYLDSNKKTTIGAFTGNNTVDYSNYFTSDDSAFEVRYIKSGAGNKLVLGKLPAVCEITSGGGLEGNKYSTLTEALAAINDGEIKLLADTTESITIQSNQNITLDLNNYVLKANTANRVILNWGKLNLVDTAETKTIKYFTDSNSDHSFDRLETSYSTASKIEGTDYVAVTGGSVVGGHLLEQNSCGSGVFNHDTLVLNGVNVVGNIATYGGAVANFGTMTIINSNLVGNYAMNGGAVYNAAAGVLTMTSGNLYTNTAQNYGGGVYNINEFTMNGGSIENCKTLDVSYGVGAGVMNTYKFTMNGGTIDSCQSAYAAGGVFSDGSAANNGHETSTFFTMTGGEIKACNTARVEHLDESLYIKNSTMSISGGKVQGTIFPNNNTHGGIDLECNISITGGYFNKNFPSDKNWIPSGYAKTNTTAVSGYTYYVAKERRTTNGGGTPSIPFYNITANAAVNGSISVSNANANAGNTVTITVKPADKYELDTLTAIDAQGNAVTLTTVKEGTTYTFVVGTSDVSVSATFKAVKEEEKKPFENPFVDVVKEEYYYDAVLWAAENGITSGADETHFAPGAITTRAQMVTFLWRAAGCPEPTKATAFTDLEKGSYYEKAVAWAVEKGITNGTSDTKFSPEETVNRAQTVTFLARYNGVLDSATGYTHAFKDVLAAEYYNNAVAWAASNGITSGISETAFAPEDSCIRAQIVTFLYRSEVK